MNKRLDLIFKIGNKYNLRLFKLFDVIILKDIDIMLKNKNIQIYYLNLLKLGFTYNYDNTYTYFYSEDKIIKIKRYFKFLLKNKINPLKYYIDLINEISSIFDSDMDYYMSHRWKLNKCSFDYIEENYLLIDFNKYTIKIIKWTIKHIDGPNNDIKTILNFIYLYTNINIKLKEWGQLRSSNLKTYKLCEYDFEKRFRKKRFTIWDSKYISNYVN